MVDSKYLAQRFVHGLIRRLPVSTFLGRRLLPHFHGRELPDHLKAMVLFTLETGLRRSKVTMLEWSHVDIERKSA